jgi:hypothetical protein
VARKAFSILVPCLQFPLPSENGVINLASFHWYYSAIYGDIWYYPYNSMTIITENNAVSVSQCRKAITTGSTTKIMFKNLD